MDWDFLEREKARENGTDMTGTNPDPNPNPKKKRKSNPSHPSDSKPRKRKSRVPVLTPVDSPSSTISAPYRASPELPNHKGFHLTVDVREPSIYAACQDISQIQNLTDAYCPRLHTKSLLLGDIELQNGQGEGVVLFERKSIPDLIASIKDGRYNEQSYRLHHACPIHPHNIVYIIEGSLVASKYPPSTIKMVRSAMVSLQFFKGFHVVRTNSPRDTAEYIMDTASRMAAKLDEGRTLYYPPKTQKENEEIPSAETTSETLSSAADPPIPSYATVVKACKKSNVTHQNIHAIMLSQIPGISPSIAEIILEGQTLEQMMDRLRQGDKWLFSLKVALSADKPPRKLNKSIIESIYLYLLNMTPPRD